MGILWYPTQGKIISSLWGIVFCIGNIILLGLTTKKTLLTWFKGGGCGVQGVGLRVLGSGLVAGDLGLKVRDVAFMVQHLRLGRALGFEL